MRKAVTFQTQILNLPDELSWNSSSFCSHPIGRPPDHSVPKTTSSAPAERRESGRRRIRRLPIRAHGMRCHDLARRPVQRRHGLRRAAGHRQLGDPLEPPHDDQHPSTSRSCRTRFGVPARGRYCARVLCVAPGHRHEERTTARSRSAQGPERRAHGGDPVARRTLHRGGSGVHRENDRRHTRRPGDRAIYARGRPTWIRSS